jgi:hypothetical protein
MDDQPVTTVAAAVAARNQQADWTGTCLSDRRCHHACCRRRECSLPANSQHSTGACLPRCINVGTDRLLAPAPADPAALAVSTETITAVGRRPCGHRRFDQPPTAVAVAIAASRILPPARACLAALAAAADQLLDQTLACLAVPTTAADQRSCPSRARLVESTVPTVAIDRRSLRYIRSVAWSGTCLLAAPVVNADVATAVS